MKKKQNCFGGKKMPIVYDNCPYCGVEQEFELEGRNQGDEEIVECEDCHKKFNFYWEASIDTITQKIDG